MKKIKLTATHISLIAPLQKRLDDANSEFSKSLFLIAGETFTNYEIKDGELIILDEEKEIIKP